MPTIKIVDTHSHMFGAAILERHHAALRDEVITILTNTQIQAATKASQEKTKQGKVVWSGKDFNVPLSAEFRRHGWQRRKLYFPDQGRYFIDVDFCKGG